MKAGAWIEGDRETGAALPLIAMLASSQRGDPNCWACHWLLLLEGSLDAVLDWMSDTAESIWREAERPGFGGSGGLRTRVEALRVYATG